MFYCSEGSEVHIHVCAPVSVSKHTHVHTLCVCQMHARPCMRPHACVYSSAHMLAHVYMYGHVACSVVSDQASATLSRTSRRGLQFCSLILCLWGKADRPASSWWSWHPLCLQQVYLIPCTCFGLDGPVCLLTGPQGVCRACH